MLYIAVALALALVVGGWSAYSAFSTAPLCTDGKQNGGEAGVDCGGPCSKLCSSQARSPVVLWARAFQTSPGVYAVAAYIENNNTGAGAKSVPYAFRLFDSDNLLIVEKGGVADIPPQQITPILESNINVGTRTVAHAFLEFSKSPMWNKIPAGNLPSVRVSNIDLAADGTRLSGTVVNGSNNDIRNLTLVAVLFDSNGTAQTASKTIIDRIPRGDSQPIVFTWPSPLSGIVRAEITPVPAL